MTTLDVPTPDLPALQQKLAARLERFRQRVRAHLVVEGIARVWAEAVGLALLSLLLDRWLRLSHPMRVAFLVAWLAYLVWEFWGYILAPLRMDLGPIALAAALDRRKIGEPNGAAKQNGHSAARADLISSRVATVLQLPALLAGPRPPSEAMVRGAVLRSHESLTGLEFSERLNHRRHEAHYGAIAIILMLLAGLVIASPATAGLWGRRWILGSNEPWPQQTYLEITGVQDGRMTVPRGEPYVLRVALKPGSVEPETITVRLRQGREIIATTPMVRFSAGDFRLDGPPLQAPVSLEVWGGDDDIGPFTLEPIERPRVMDLQLLSQHPTQPKPEMHSFSGQDADMAFLPKTKLELTITSNVPVASARLTSNAARPSGADLRRVDDRRFALAWTQEQAVQMQVEFVSQQGGLTSLPTPIAIGLKLDQPPRVALQYTGVRQRVSPQVKIPLTVQARDDYGIARVDLAFTADAQDPTKTVPTQANSITLMGPEDHPTNLEIQPQYTMDVAGLKLAPGAVLSLTGQATDACYTGPQTGRSRTVSFRVVPPEELFREILLRQQAERSKFRKAIGEAEKIRDSINTLVSQEAAAQAARQHRLVQAEAWRIWNSLSESLTEMRLNALGSPEAYDLMDKKILGPLRQLHDQEMSQQRDALESLGRVEDAKRLTDAAARQEQIISRMQDILKQMAQWDSFVDVLNQLNEIIRMEQSVQKNTDDIRQKQTESVFDK